MDRARYRPTETLSAFQRQRLRKAAHSEVDQPSAVLSFLSQPAVVRAQLACSLSTRLVFCLLELSCAQFLGVFFVSWPRLRCVSLPTHIHTYILFFAENAAVAFVSEPADAEYCRCIGVLKSTEHDVCGWCCIRLPKKHRQLEGPRNTDRDDDNQSARLPPGITFLVRPPRRAKQRALCFVVRTLCSPKQYASPRSTL